MSNEHEHSTAEFARRLVTLTPAATLTRDQVLFEAGRSAGRKEAAPWRVVASVMTVGMISLLAFETWSGTTPPMALRTPPRENKPRAHEQVAQTEVRPVPTPRASSSIENADYIRLRDLILERGVDAMPRTLATASTNKAETLSPNDDDAALWRLRMKQLGGSAL